MLKSDSEFATHCHEGDQSAGDPSPGFANSIILMGSRGLAYGRAKPRICCPRGGFRIKSAKIRNRDFPNEPDADNR